ncbi:MAG: hypothetical protein JNK82_25455, partial [Myxococcaceae bacterium]|nr:hypothetical protein [Myxococcaceae bacterium]
MKALRAALVAFIATACSGRTGEGGLLAHVDVDASLGATCIVVEVRDDNGAVLANAKVVRSTKTRYAVGIFQGTLPATVAVRARAMTGASGCDDPLTPVVDTADQTETFVGATVKELTFTLGCGGASETCNDGADNDCDGMIDCADPQCASAACGAGRTCQGGTCRCASGCCSSTDCTGGQTCQSGACTCPAGQKLCGTSCISQSACCNTGDCSSVMGSQCDGGSCSCPAGQKACGSSCIAGSSCCSPTDCPATGQQCVSGTCACPAGQAPCNGACAPGGCCVDADCGADAGTCS